MVNRVFEQVLRFFGTIATALTGLGALCTAAGFLAERTRWSMLGFPGAPTDLNDYLFTGARFLAFLPGIVLTSVLTAAAASLTALLFAVVAVIAFVLFRRRAARRATPQSPATESPWLRRARPWALVALALAQIAGCLMLFQAGRLRNVLFADRTALAGAECGRAGLDLEAEVMLGCEAQLTERMGRAFLIVLFSAGALWLLLPASLRRPAVPPEPGSPRAPLPATLFVNAGLLAVQVVLLPINYGTLFLRNEFALVEVKLAEPELRAERWPVDNRFSLLHRRDDEFYLYAPSARRIWLVPRDDMRALTYLGICRVFDPADACRTEDAALQTLQELP